jgi:hypothetical protein
MNLENVKNELQEKLNTANDNMDAKFHALTLSCNVDHSIYSYTIIQDFESDDFHVKIINDDFQVSVNIEEIKTKADEISIRLKVPSHWSLDHELMDEESYEKTKTHFEKSQEIFKLGSYIKENIDSMKPNFIDMFRLQEEILELKFQISQKKENINNNLDNTLLNDIIEHLQISDTESNKELFNDLDFEYNNVVNLISVESFRNSSNQNFIKFSKDVLDIQNSGRLNLKFNGSRIAKKDVESKLRSRILFDGEFDQNFNSIQKLLGIPEPDKNQSSIHILGNDFYDLLENQKKKNEVLDFVENKKTSLVKTMLDIDPFSDKKKKIGLFGLK